MSKTTLRRQGEYMRSVFGYLAESSNGLMVKEILKRLKDDLKLSEYESGYFPSSPGTERFTKLVRFSSIPFVKAGWLTKGKGRWQVTNEGEEAYEQYIEPEVFFREASKIYQEWKGAREIELDVQSEIQTDDRISQLSEISIEEAAETAWERILDYLRSVDGYEFQDLTAALLSAMGYYVNWIAPRGKDFGVDIVAFTDPIGAGRPRIVCQVKHRLDSTTSSGDLRSFLQVIPPDDVGIFVSSGGFTKDAEDEARKQENKKITLINLDKFIDLWIEYYEKLSDDGRQKLPLRPIYFLSL